MNYIHTKYIRVNLLLFLEGQELSGYLLFQEDSTATSWPLLALGAQAHCVFAKDNPRAAHAE
jgi:hypothetical protein